MLNRKVNRIMINWFYDTENGEQYGYWITGKYGVKEINYHEPMGEGDRHYCDVIKEDGTIHREFNLNSIEFEPES